jgi:hypothetical protein
MVLEILTTKFELHAAFCSHTFGFWLVLQELSHPGLALNASPPFYSLRNVTPRNG